MIDPNVKAKLYPGMLCLMAKHGDVVFKDYPLDPAYPPPLPNKSTSISEGYFIKSRADGKNHVLPHGAALPILFDDGTWNPPTESEVRGIRQLIFSCTNIEALNSPEWSRVRELLRNFKDDNQPANTPLNETDTGWHQRNFHTFAGGSPLEGWYDGVAFKTQANGFNNWHYNMAWWIGINWLLEDDADKRAAQWPYVLEQLLAYCAFGRDWTDAGMGQSLDEKGQHRVGDSNRRPYSKYYVLNLIMGALLTNQHDFFMDQIRAEGEFWKTKTADQVWKSYWGAREGTRNLSNAAYIALVAPDMRGDMVKEATDMLDNYDKYLDRSSWVWPNLGNGGNAEESPWMAAQVVADILRVWELLPETQGHGPSRQDLVNIVDTILSDYGSVKHGNWHLLRYRYHTVQTPAHYSSLTAWIVPALRLLGHPLYEHYATLSQQYCGSYTVDIANGSPRPIDEIGARDARNGAANIKILLQEIEAVR